MLAQRDGESLVEPMRRLDRAIASAAKTSMTIDEIKPPCGFKPRKELKSRPPCGAVRFHYVNSCSFCKERFLSPQGFIQ